ncbi:hypothetical protein QYE76_018689 [Lolium multiflorum]|uniref:PROP1-like PPR domain-containing protein n=1 Tax=Lolium multiflorum TaxID=4521 RepID=A0AAD8V8E0_LOLMU|nr:hypothetical protein QYE76_018689 [Lolium multiflorum]
MAMASAPLLSARSAAVSVTCSSREYEEDDGGAVSWSLSSGTRSSSSSRGRRLPPYRRLLHDEARRLRGERRGQGAGAETPRWVRRTEGQMARYIEDDRAGHVHGRHVVAAVRAARATASRPPGSMREAMASFVTKLTFREMCVVLREQRGWRQAQEFFSWMKLQLCYEPSVVAYTILLRVYGQTGRIEHAEETFLEMLEAGVEPDAVACGTLLCAYARRGRHGDMMLFYEATRRRGVVPPVPAFNFMLSSLQKHRLHGKVIHLWNQMVQEANVVPNQFTYTVVIGSFVKEGLLEEAMEVLGKMKRSRIVPDEATYSGLISLSARHGRGEQALGLYEEMRDHGIVPSNYTCASLLALYDKNGDYSKALSLFSEMERSKIVPDEVIYGILVRIYGKIGLYEDAQRTFEEIDMAGMLSDEQTYVAMAQVHMNAGNYDRALLVLDSMRSRSVKPSPFSYNALLRCHVAKEDIAAAEHTFRVLTKYGLPDVFCCNDLLRLYIKLGQLDKASALILEMTKEDVQLDVGLYMTVMEVCCKSGMTADADKVLKEMHNDGVTVKSSTMVSPIEIYARNNIRLIWEENTSSKMLDCRTDSSALSTTLKSLLDTPGGSSIACQLIRKFAREGSTEEAKFLHEQLTALGVKPEDSATATLIVQYGQKQKLQKAQLLFESASAWFPVGGLVYNAMVDALCKCSKTDEAYHLFMEMVDRGHIRDAVTISILVTHLTKHGKFQEAENIMHDCFAGEVELDTVVYNTFIKSMLESGKLYSAVSIYDRMIASGVPRSLQTFNIMISVYGLGGKLDKATEMFTAAQELGLPIDEKIYTNMLNIYGKAGRHQEASLLFSRMKERGIMPGQISFNSMINAYAASGQHHKAEVTFQEMQSCSHAPDSLTYLALIRAYTQGGCYTKAEEAIQMMLGSNITPSSLHFNHLIFNFLKEGQIDEAHRICSQMRDIAVAADLACCRTMMRAYLEHGRVDEGISLFEMTCRLLKPDSFILSAAFHLYEHSGRESEAGDVLDVISLHGASFLRNLKVGSKLRPT